MFNKRLLKLLLTSIVFFTQVDCFAKTISLNAEAIQYQGRVTAQQQFAWTGSGFEFGIDKGSVTATFDSLNDSSALTVIVDGLETVIYLTKGNKPYLLAENLVPGTHQISIFKRNEAGRGTVQLTSLTIDDSATLVKLKQKPNKLLAIGDSITCGYGNEALNSQEGNTRSNQNGYLSYVAISARRLNAELMLTCWSGRGMFRNRNIYEDKVGVLPELFKYTLPREQQGLWQHQKFVPDWILINLGTNDISNAIKKGPLNKSDYLMAYQTFVEQLLEYYPKAELIFAIGPMKHNSLNVWLAELSDRYDNATDLQFSAYDNPTDVGGHYHPSISKHKQMADTLVDHINN